MKYFHPVDTRRVIQNIRESLPRLITLSHAEAILQETGQGSAAAAGPRGLDVLDIHEKADMPQESNAAGMGKKAERGSVEPLCVMIAHSKRLQASLLPPNQAADHFKRIRACQEAKERIEYHLAIGEEMCARYQLSTRDPIYAIDAGRKRAALQSNQEEMEKLLAAVDITNKSMLVEHRLAQYVKSSDPKIVPFALNAQKKVETYRKKIYQTLEISGVDMKRAEHLLKYLVGPEEFLFERYALEPCDPTGEYRGWFYLNHGNPAEYAEPPHRFKFALNNNSAWELENEISSKISMAEGRAIDFSSRFIQTRVVTKPVLKEVEDFRAEITSLLRRWTKKEEGSQDLHIEAMKKLMNRWEWDSEIAEDVGATIIAFDQEMEGVKITFTRKQPQRSFWLNLVDCSTIYQHGSGALVDIPSIETLIADQGQYTHRV